MTVAYELAQLTGMKVFHNHMTIELVLEIFPYGHERFRRLVAEFRRRIFEEVAESELVGLIFTYVWTLDHPSDKEEIDAYSQIFRKWGATVYFVELEADLENRLERNKTEFRLSKKPSKRDVDGSQERLIQAEQRYKMNSRDDFFYQENYLKINNTHLTARETAQRIMDTFGFEPLQSG